MDVRLINEAELAASSLQDVVSYLQGRGWVESYRDVGGSAWVVNDPALADGPELWVPRSKAMRGYRSRIATLLDTLSNFEGRSPAQILFDIAHSLLDVQRIRSLPESSTGTVPLVDGSEALRGIHHWIRSAAAAATAGSPGPVLPKRPPRSVDNFMRQVRLEVPEPGSFTWKVTVPLSGSSETQTIPFGDLTSTTELASFNRRITRRLYASTAAVLQACRDVQRGTSMLDAFTAAIPSGVTADLCDALAETSSKGRVPYEISFAWASSAPAPGSTTLNFDNSVLEVVSSAAEALRRHTEPVTDTGVLLRGTIRGLSRESNQRPGTVRISGTLAEDPDQKSGSFWLELTGDDYPNAVEAHLSHAAVEARGDIIHRGNRRHLVNVRSFRVVEQ